jgi:ribosome-associated protein
LIEGRFFYAFFMGNGPLKTSALRFVKIALPHDYKGQGTRRGQRITTKEIRIVVTTKTQPKKKTTKAVKAVAKKTAKPTTAKKVTAKAKAKPTAKPAKPAAKKTTPKKAPAKKPAAVQKTAPKGLPEQMLDAALTILDDRKGEDIVAVDLRGKSPLADYAVIATGRSGRQLAAMADYVGAAFAKLGVRRIRVEGAQQGDWVLLDAGDVIVHLFRPEVRNFYNLDAILGATSPKSRGA